MRAQLRSGKLAAEPGPGAQARNRELLDHLGDDTSDSLSPGVRPLNAAWANPAAGGTLRLEWPVPCAFFGTMS
ncbi:MAG TPA: hypothetical protein VGD83_37290 [Streptosporangiaceae bacterium]